MPWIDRRRRGEAEDVDVSVVLDLSVASVRDALASIAIPLRNSEMVFAPLIAVLARVGVASSVRRCLDAPVAAVD